jgi:hypothetical protein
VKRGFDVVVTARAARGSDVMLMLITIYRLYLYPFSYE